MSYACVTRRPASERIGASGISRVEAAPCVSDELQRRTMDGLNCNSMSSFDFRLCVKRFLRINQSCHFYPVVQLPSQSRLKSCNGTSRLMKLCYAGSRWCSTSLDDGGYLIAQQETTTADADMRDEPPP